MTDAPAPSVSVTDTAPEYSASYPPEWRAVVREVRVLVMFTEDEPTQADWLRAEVMPPDREHRAMDRVREIVAEYASLHPDTVVWVYAGHNGPYAPGVWKWWFREGPPGWLSGRELELRALERLRHNDALARAAAEKEAKAEKDRLRRAGISGPKLDATDAIVSGALGKVTQRTIDSRPIDGWAPYEVSADHVEVDEFGEELPF